MTLIEVLVAVVVLAFGVLAAATLQLTSKRNNGDAGARSLAAQLGYDILQRMRMNRSTDALSTYLQNAASGIGRGQQGPEPAPNCTSSTCSRTQVADHDLWVFEQQLDGNFETLTAGSTTASVGGFVNPTACVSGPAGGVSGTYTVTIVWKSNREVPDNSGVTCGSAAVDGSGNRLYGSNDEFRRSVTTQGYITNWSLP